MTDTLQKTISHNQARRIAQKFIDHYFKNPEGERIQICIPPTDGDDDLNLMAYIEQQRKKDV